MKAFDSTRHVPFTRLGAVGAVVIALVGVGARGGGLEGSQNTGTFKLVPISTTTTA